MRLSRGSRVLTLTMAAATADSFKYQDFAFCTNLTNAVRTTSLPSHVLPPNAFSRLGHSSFAASTDTCPSLTDTAMTESATVLAAVCFSVH
jgi:hypothetical protein